MRRTILAAVALAAIASTPGCFFLGEPADLRRDVARSWDLTVEKETGIELGRITTAIARAFARGDGEDSLEGIRKIELGVYRVLERGAGVDQRRPLRLDGWEPVVHARDGEGNETWVLYRLRGGSIRGLALVSLDGDELVLTRLSGSLEGWLEALLREGARDGREGVRRAAPGTQT